MFAYGSDNLGLTLEEVIVRWWKEECPPAMKAAILRRADEHSCTWWDIVHDHLLTFTKRLNASPALQKEFLAFVARIETPFGLDPHLEKDGPIR